MSAISIADSPTSLADQQLELSQLESYFVADDRPDYPMTFFAMMEFSGRLDREAFCRATRIALTRHPLLRARLGKAADGKEVWQVDEDAEPVISWVESDWPTGSPQPRLLDLRNGHGLHTWVEALGNKTRIAWQVHHACVDGLGSLVFAEDVLSVYAAEIGCSDGLKVRPVDLQCLSARLTHDRPTRDLPPIWKILRHLVKQFFNHFLRVPVVLTSADRTKQLPLPEGPYPHLAMQTFDESLTDDLRACATSMEATFNEVLLAILYQTLAQWQQKHRGPGKWLRVLIPTDLRNAKHAHAPACNILGYTFWDRNPSECKSAVAILPGIVQQSGLIRRYRLGRTFLDGVSIARALGILPRMVRMRRSEATVVFTNPGDLTRGAYARFPRKNGKQQMGNLLLEDIYGSVPLRPGTRVCVMVTRYRRRYRLTWIIDPKYLSVADRTELMRMYEGNVHAFIRQTKPSTTA